MSSRMSLKEMQGATACQLSRIHQKAAPVPALAGKISTWEAARLKWVNWETGFGFLYRPGQPDVHFFVGTLVAAGLAGLKPHQRVEVRWRMQRRGPHAMYMRSAYGKKKRP